MSILVWYYFDLWYSMSGILRKQNFMKDKIFRKIWGQSSTEFFFRWCFVLFFSYSAHLEEQFKQPCSWKIKIICYRIGLEILQNVLFFMKYRSFRILYITHLKKIKFHTKMVIFISNEREIISYLLGYIIYKNRV